MKRVLMVLMLLGSENLFAGAPDILWTKAYGGKYNDLAYSVLQASDGNYMVCGYTRNPYVAADVWLMKIDSLGDSLWTKRYGDSLSEQYGYFMYKTSDSGYIISSQNSYKAGLIKIDSNGNEQWNKTYSRAEGFVDIKQTMDGGYVVCSDSGSPSKSILTKTDSAGNALWTKIYNTPGNNEIHSVIQTPDSGYLLCCDYSYSYSSTFLIKTDKSGDTVWTKAFSNIGGRNMQKTNDGNYIICGDSSSRMVLMKIDGNGNQLWSKKLGGHFAYYVQQTNDSGYIVCGGTSANACLVKTDTGGNVQWTKAFDDTAECEFHYVQQTKDNGYVCCGYVLPNLKYDWLIMKTGPEIGVEENSKLKSQNSKLGILQNPVVQQTVINYSSTVNGKIGINMYDISGKLVKVLVNEEKPAGSYSVNLDGNGLAPGVYFIRLSAGNLKQVKKLVLMK